MKLINELNKLELNDNNKYFLENIINSYLDYIDIIDKFDNKLLEKFLYTLKQMELLNNQQAEQENSLLISIYNNMHKENSLDRMIKILNQKDKLTKEELKDLHKLLMMGTKNESETNDFRNDDNKFVGSFNIDGTKNIDYIPISYKEIDKCMSYVIDIINYQNINDPFIKSFVIHALISVLQPFDDGNTRLSRLIQHGKIWKDTNKIFSKKFEKPILYLSKNYLLTRGNYRELLANLAREEDNYAWNKWFNYNLNMVDEQLFYISTNVKKLIK